MTRYKAGAVEFTSKKPNITHCVLFGSGEIAAKCGSLEAAEKAKAKDERLYKLAGMSIVKVEVLS